MSPPPTPLPIHIRPATPHDIPTIATISVRAFWNDPLYAYTNPWRLSHPDSFRNHFLRRTRERYWTPSWRFVVAEVDTSEARGEASEGEGGDGGEGNGKREVVGFTCWHREHGDLKKGGWDRNSWYGRLERTLAILENKYVALLGLDRSVCKPNLAKWTVEGHKKEFPEGEPILYLQNLCVLPHHTRRGIGGKLVQWGIQRGREEGVMVGLSSSPMAEKLYKREGLKVVRVMETPIGDCPVLEWRPGGDEGGGEGKGGGGEGGKEGMNG